VRSRRPMLSLAILLGMLYCQASWANYKDDYQDGVKAAERGDWATAKRIMQSVLQENSKPSRRLRTYGVNFIQYVPHYYLGMAEMNLGDCQAALQALNNAASQAVVKRLSDLASRQNSAIQQCDDKLRLAQNDPPPQPIVVPPKPVVLEPEPVQPPPRPVVAAPPAPTPKPTPTAKLATRDVNRVSGALSQAQRSSRTIESSLGAAPLAGTGDARALNKDLDDSKDQLSSAATQLANARRQDSPSQLTQAENAIKTVTSDLAMLGDRVEAAKQGLAAAELAMALDRSKRRARQSIAELAPLFAKASAAGDSTATARTAVQRQSEALTSAIGGSDGNAISRAQTALGRARSDLEKAIAAAPQPAPDELRRYVGLYLSGDYATVAIWGAPDRLPDAKDQANGLLLRAAARLHQFVGTGEMDNTLRAAIDADLRKAKSLDRALKPNPQAFPPRLIELFSDA